MKEGDKIYAAAVLDQGSFFEIRDVHGGRPYIRIRRNNAEIIRPIKMTFGGSFGFARDGHYWLNFSGPACKDFLIAVLPYLKVKHNHAQVILDFISHFERRLLHVKKGTNLNDAEREIRRQLIDRMKRLNGATVRSEPSTFDITLSNSDDPKPSGTSVSKTGPEEQNPDRASADTIEF